MENLLEDRMGMLAERMYSGIGSLGERLGALRDRVSEEFDSRVRFSPTFRKAYGAAMFALGAAEFIPTWYEYLTSESWGGGSISNYIISNGPTFDYRVYNLAALGAVLFHVYAGVLPLLSAHGLKNISEGFKMEKPDSAGS